MKKLNKKGFTLAELLIVVAIIAVLVAIAIPIFNGQLKKAQETADEGNLRAAYGQAVIHKMETNSNWSSVTALNAVGHPKSKMNFPDVISWKWVSDNLAVAYHGTQVSFKLGAS